MIFFLRAGRRIGDVPMRMSADKNHPDFHPGRYEVYVDGKVVPMATYVDTDLGIVRYYSQNDDGSVQVCPACKTPILKTLRGEVVLRSLNV